MKRQELYEKTVDILVQAYFNDTLRHGDCAACAVGNLINARKKFSTEERKKLNALGGYEREGWSEVFCTYNRTQQEIIPFNYKGLAKKQIDLTGYTYNQLAKIEKAFETADAGKSDEDWMFNGLMAVIDVLDKIHKNTDTNVTENSKNKFNKQLCPQ